jgi:hypothetical protein
MSAHVVALARGCRYVLAELLDLFNLSRELAGKGLLERLHRGFVSANMQYVNRRH